MRAGNEVDESRLSSAQINKLWRYTLHSITSSWPALYSYPSLQTTAKKYHNLYSLLSHSTAMKTFTLVYPKYKSTFSYSTPQQPLSVA